MRAPRITDSMKEAAARGIAAAVPPEKLCADYILPTAFDRGVADIVAKAVARRGGAAGHQPGLIEAGPAREGNAMFEIRAAAREEYPLALQFYDDLTDAMEGAPYPPGVEKAGLSRRRIF